MARAKTTQRSKKKSRAKTKKNRFYVVNAIQDARTNLTGRLEDYNRNYVTEPIETGKTFVKDLKDGQAFLTKAGKNPMKTLNELMDEGKEQIDGLRSRTRERLEDLAVDLKVMREGVEKDSRMVIADVIDGSKKALDQVPGKQRIEKEITSRLQAIPAAFDLPSKKDIDALKRQIKTLNTKVNKLSKTSAV